ncbi:MAG: glycosyltransferase family 4 protein [Limisphaerales bacterium]
MNFDASEKRLTIIHTEASNGWGGQEIRILTESRWFRGRGHRVLIGCVEDGILYRKALEDGFEVKSFSFKKRTTLIDIIRLARWFKKVKPDVVATHSSEDTWSGLVAGRIARIPVLIRYRHVSVPIKPNLANKVLYKKLCDCVITTASCIKEELTRLADVEESRVKTIPTGIHPPAFTMDREMARMGLAKTLNLPLNARFIGCVAVLRGWKGHRYLLEAFDAIAEKIPDYRLIIAGDGPAKEGLLMLREQLSHKEKIHFIGHQNDTFNLFWGFELAVLASVKNEGVPQSLLQAMFAGCPVLGTKIGGIPDIIKQGETGWLVEPNSAQSLAEGILNAITNYSESKRMAENALKFVNENFTLEKMGKTVEKTMYEFLTMRCGGK